MSYNYSSETHNETDPNILVPIFINLFNPLSVVDIGCGIGNFLSVFKKNGVTDILGIDSDFNSFDQRRKYLLENEFLQFDLTKKWNFDKHFDLAICLEVAEHLPFESAETLVENLTKVSNTVIFSAAIPLQGGQFHVNEQWQSYWGDIFEKRGFSPVDCIRPIIWNNLDISYWYKQNIIVYCNSNSLAKYNLISSGSTYCNIVHPDNYLSKVTYLENLLSGSLSLKYYVYFMYKFLIKKFRF